MSEVDPARPTVIRGPLERWVERFGPAAADLAPAALWDEWAPGAKDAFCQVLRSRGLAATLSAMRGEWQEPAAQAGIDLDRFMAAWEQIWAPCAEGLDVT